MRRLQRFIVGRRRSLAAIAIVLVVGACSARLEPVLPEAVRLHPIPERAAAPARPGAAAGLPELASGPPREALAALAAARPRRQVLETGIASWYGPGFAGRPTANGEAYDPAGMTAAHKELPLGAEVIVVNLENGREARLRINDRGPFVGERVIDVSQAAARRLGFYHDGLARVRIDLVLPRAVREEEVTASVDG